MKKLISYSLIAFITISFSSCNSGSQETQSIDKSVYREKGSKISKAAQATLLSNVAEAIQEKGISQAIDYCNVQAFQITDSLSKMNSCKIQRITDRNRNPNNGLKTKQDQNMWDHYKNLKLGAYKDSVLLEDQSITYYKPIPIMMPTCLKCHGLTNQIDLETKTRIASLYPLDKAVGYEMNDLRGLWKITWDNMDQSQ